MGEERKEEESRRVKLIAYLKAVGSGGFQSAAGNCPTRNVLGVAGGLNQAKTCLF